MMSLRNGGFFILGGGKGGREGKGFGDPLLSGWGDAPQSQNDFLILPIDLCVKTLKRLGRDYPWRRPERCLRCGGVRVWGHGFVGAYLDEAGSELVFLKRYRCPECGVVIRTRPSAYFRRIQACIEKVRGCLCQRITKGRWPPKSNPPRQRHWLRALKRNVRGYLGMNWAEKLEEGFEELLRRGICAVSRSD